jgi:hypothetical protein
MLEGSAGDGGQAMLLVAQSLGSEGFANLLLFDWEEV